MQRATQTVTLSNGTNQSRYLWLLLGAILLALVILWPLLGRRLAPSAQSAAAQTAAAQQAGSLSPADAARRAFIASLGPIKRRPGTNAADFYKRAAGLYAQLTDDERNMLNDKPGKLDPKAAAALYAKIQPIMDLIRQGRTADYTDWGTEPNTLNDWISFDSIPAVDGLAVPLWDAAYQFQAGDPNGAINDLAAGEDMARNGIDNYLWYGTAVQYHIQAVTLLAQNPASLGDNSADLDDILDPEAPQRMLQEAMDSLDSVIQPELDEYSNPATQAGSVIQQNAVSDSVTPEQEYAQVQWIMDASHVLLATLTQPDSEFEQTWAPQAASAPSTLPGYFVDGGKQLHFVSQTVATSNAMLAAGLALEQGDQAQYESITDPTTGQPFTYTQTATGFQLQFAPTQDPSDDPVKLDFPAPQPQ